MERIWETRDLPVLRALAEHFDAIDAPRLGVDQLVKLTGMTEDSVQRALRDLWQADPRLIDGSKADELPYPVSVTEVTERGLRMIGAWPDPQQLAERLLTGLERAIEAEPDEERRGRLHQAFEALRGVGKDVFVQVAANVITGAM